MILAPEMIQSAHNFPAVSIQPSDRLAGLDGIRGIAILLVLMHNLLILGNTPDRIVQRTGYLLDAGWTGVHLFFVLSGFLITRVLLRTRHAENYYQAFYARRALRILPLYYGTLVGLFLLWPVLEGAPEAIRNDAQWPLWLFLSNWTMPFGWGGSSVPHFWSLALEEQFYLLWPLLVHRRTPESVLKLCLWAALASVLLRVLLRMEGVSPELIYTITPCHLDALGAGGALAALLEMPRARAWMQQRIRLLGWAACLIAVTGAVATQGYPRTSAPGQTLGYAMLAALFGLVVALTVFGSEQERANPFCRLLAWRPLGTIGRYSFGMYVLHKPMHDFLGKPLLVSVFGTVHTSNLDTAIAYLLFAGVAIFLAALVLYHLLEKPFLSLKPEPAMHGDGPGRARQARL